MFIVYWFFHRCSHSTLDKTVLNWCYYTKIKQAKEPQYYIFPFELYQIPHMGKYSHVDHARRTCITVYPNMVTNSQTYVLRISRHFCGYFEKHSMGKHKENLRTVYNLFDHWNMALSSDFRHLKTLLATRLVFHLFWRWQPVAHAPFQQPQSAAVWKLSRPRTSDTAIWAPLIIAVQTIFLRNILWSGQHYSFILWRLRSHKPLHKLDSNKYQSKPSVICDHKSDDTRSVTHVNKVYLVLLMFRVLSNQHYPHRTNQKLCSWANAVFQNHGVCGQAFPSFPSPVIHFFFALVPTF